MHQLSTRLASQEGSSLKPNQSKVLFLEKRWNNHEKTSFQKVADVNINSGQDNWAAAPHFNRAIVIIARSDATIASSFFFFLVLDSGLRKKVNAGHL